jgi:hypothetical protein
MIKTNIKMRVTPEQSKKVQEICFENGIDWGFNDKQIRYTEEPFIIIKKSLAWSGDNQEDCFNDNGLEEINANFFIRTNGTCIEKEEFTYPMWFESKTTKEVVRFDGLSKGEVIVSKNKDFPVGFYSLNIEPHTSIIWKQIENPNLATDKEIEQVINEEYEKDSLINKDKQDMINPSHYKKGGIETIDYMKAKSTPEEFKGHLRLTALKYLSRYGQKDNELQELEKAKWYLDRLIQELKNEN